MKKYEYHIIMRILDLVGRDMDRHQNSISKKSSSGKKNEKEKKNPTRAIKKQREAIHSTEMSKIPGESKRKISSKSNAKFVIRTAWKKLLRKIKRNRESLRIILILIKLIMDILTFIRSLI